MIPQPPNAPRHSNCSLASTTGPRCIRMSINIYGIATPASAQELPATHHLESCAHYQYQLAWRHLSMDFIAGLPWSNGFNAILIMVCRLTKMRHLIPCRDTCTAEQLADLFAHHIFRLHGLPESIISDRGTQFTAKFWKALCGILNPIPP